LYSKTKVTMFDSEHVLEKLGKLTNYGSDFFIVREGRRRESINMTIYQGIDFGGSYGTG